MIVHVEIWFNSRNKNTKRNVFLSTWTHPAKKDSRNSCHDQSVCYSKRKKGEELPYPIRKKWFHDRSESDSRSKGIDQRKSA